VGDGSLQSHSGENLHPKSVKNRGNVAKGGEADGVSLTVFTLYIPPATGSRSQCGSECEFMQDSLTATFLLHVQQHCSFAFLKLHH
jgi:hypothetical protein